MTKESHPSLVKLKKLLLDWSRNGLEIRQVLGRSRKWISSGHLGSELAGSHRPGYPGPRPKSF